MTVRRLTEDDREHAINFAKERIETAFFFANNLSFASMQRDPNTPFTGDYFGYFENEKIHGLIGTFWNGNILVCAPKGIIELATILRDHIAENRIPIEGICGPMDNIDDILDTFGLNHQNKGKKSTEFVMRLELDSIIEPERIDDPRLNWQHPEESDKDFLIRWLYEYDQEAIERSPSPELWIENEEEFKLHTALASNYVLRDNGEPVSYAGVNSSLPDMVQVGPMWTPPEHRNKGYARTALAGSLIRKREQGVKTAFLFADDPYAISCYKSIGFVDTNIEYGLCVFDEKQELDYNESSKITGT